MLRWCCLGSDGGWVITVAGRLLLIINRSPSVLDKLISGDRSMVKVLYERDTKIDCEVARLLVTSFTDLGCELFSLAMHCRIVEFSQVGGGQAQPCGKAVSGQCFDCGTNVCEAHAHACDICKATFCSTCFRFHAKFSHNKKPAHSVPARDDVAGSGHSTPSSVCGSSFC